MMMKKALFLVSFGAGLVLNQAGGIRRDGDMSSTRRTSETSAGLQELYFSETLTGDDTVTVLEVGGFRLTASCKTVTFTQEDLLGLYSSTTTYAYMRPSFASTSAPRFSPRGGPTVTSPRGSHDGDGSTSSSSSSSGYRSYPSADNPGPHPPARGDGDGSSNGSGGDPSGIGPGRGPQNGAESSSSMPFGPSSAAERDLPGRRWNNRARETHPCRNPPRSEAGADTPYAWCKEDGYDYDEYDSHYSGIESDITESFAALELTYTASGDDYLYGFPSHPTYPEKDLMAGTYGAGESRTQTVFAGRNGFSGDTCTFQSMSGSFLSINGDRTIGVHRSFAEGMGSMWSSEFVGSPEDKVQHSGFPEGVDCMVAGVITYVGEVDRPFKIV